MVTREMVDVAVRPGRCLDHACTPSSPTGDPAAAAPARVEAVTRRLGHGAVPDACGADLDLM
ncbi:hypothetical protein Sru01_49380 [Sphaerisporangium rufum]|uniref:Uncharacterized protein n=1 Tax=Sphaerisporangium rufum TaxID=1381558 RepID=A0A919R5A9_9ACTN|nr:hypothetical protein Sru01_49380 [Sphaerisporangium rufum]